MEWVEVAGSTVEVAVQAALEELGLQSADDATVEVLQEAKPGFLGMGGQEAIVKVVRAPKQRRRRGGRRSGGGKKQSKKTTAPSSEKKRAAKSQPPRQQDGKQRMDTPTNDKPERPEPAPIEEQAAVATAFLDGLLEAFGLEGETKSRIEEDVLYLDVEGEQTEALVGPKGTTMHSVLELTRTTVQRKTYGAPRMRIDIAGYGARRREALTIYTQKLAEQVLSDGGEIMLEPMNAADRKVVHDAAADIDGVRTHSEGDDPKRAVVISPA
jgi:spoIIIJ-associated protein